MRFDEGFWRQLAIALLVWAIVLVALIYQAVAHEWYPDRCCDGRHCRVVACAALSRSHGGLRYQPAGIAEQIISGGVDAFYFDREQIEASPDGRCHVCTNLRQGVCVFVPDVGY